MKEIKINNLKFLFLDFDGVLTNNKVFVNEMGVESVECNRSDGLYSDLIKKKFSLDIIIISSEKNKVVKVRSKKMKIHAEYGVKNKFEYINNFLIKKKINFKNLIYIGNDINDFEAMKHCHFKICPSDAVQEIKKISDIVLKTKGGDGILREVFHLLDKKYE